MPTKLTHRIGLVCGVVVAIQAAGTRAEQGAAAEPAPGTFLAPSGEIIPFRPEYQEWFPAQPPDPHYLRAAVEVTALIGIGTAHYWLNKNANSRDWDFPNFFERLTFEGIRFDNNTFLTNFLGHPLAGTGYYTFSRANNLSVVNAMITTELGSLLWEYGLEWREQVSVNDMVFTPVAGIAMGEFFHRLGDYLHSSPAPTPAQHVAAATLGLPITLHTLDHKHPRRSPALDNLGYSSNYWHDFRLGYVFASTANEASDSQSLHGGRLAADLFAMPGMLQPGDFDVLFASGNFTQMRAHLLLGEPGVAEGSTWFRSTLVGYYQQDFKGTPRDSQGSASMLGLGTGVDYLSRFTLGRKDQRATAHFTGSHFGYWLKHGDLSLRIMGDVHADFAAIRSLEFEALREQFPNDTFKAVLEEQGYQFHLGASGDLEARVAWGNVALEAHGHYGRYGSVEGLDRRNEQITRDPEGQELDAQFDLDLKFRPPATPLTLSIGYLHDFRESRVGDLEQTRQERRVSSVLGVEL